jgi:hypothetical protein
VGKEATIKRYNTVRDKTNGRQDIKHTNANPNGLALPRSLKKRLNNEVTRLCDGLVSHL